MKLHGHIGNIALRSLISLLLAAALLSGLAQAQAQPPASGATKEFHPLTPSQKFQAFAQTTYDPLVWTTAAFDAGIDQATNSPSDWGQGGEAYGKRFGAAMAT